MIECKVLLKSLPTWPSQLCVIKPQSVASRVPVCLQQLATRWSSLQWWSPGLQRQVDDADARTRTGRSFTSNRFPLRRKLFLFGQFFQFFGFPTNTSSENVDTVFAILGTCRRFSPTATNAANAPVTFMAMQNRSCACWCALPCWRAASHATLKSERRGRTSGPDSTTPARFEADACRELSSDYFRRNKLRLSISRLCAQAI